MKTDERAFNFRKAPSIQHRIRKIVQGNVTGDVYGITLPKVIAEPLINCWMRIYATQTGQIILESGCKISADDIKENKRYCFDGVRVITNKFGQTEVIK